VKIAISAGHSEDVGGAVGYLNEFDENVRVVNRCAEIWKASGVPCVSYVDRVSDDQTENLNRLVDWHNAQDRTIDLSIHFNAGGGTGTEVLYVTQEELADKVSAAIAQTAGWADRGGKYRTDLFWLSNCDAPAILIEVCFVDHRDDASTYAARFDAICSAICETVSGQAMPAAPPAEARRRRTGMRIAAQFNGPCSWFGGPEDTTGVTASEDLAWWEVWDDITDDGAEYLFLPHQPPNTTGLARRLNPTAFYLACPWDYDETPKTMLADKNNFAIVYAPASNKSAIAHPADFGPHGDTGRAADLSKGLMEYLEIETDDIVLVIYLVKHNDHL
jgi:N-acetylmuramoyl-L-alanine amidase